jgi:hypothetical protein
MRIGTGLMTSAKMNSWHIIYRREIIVHAQLCKSRLMKICPFFSQSSNMDKYHFPKVEPAFAVTGEKIVTLSHITKKQSQ